MMKSDGECHFGFSLAYSTILFTVKQFPDSDRTAWNAPVFSLLSANLNPQKYVADTLEIRALSGLIGAKWAVSAEKVWFRRCISFQDRQLIKCRGYTGGKAKPLKAPKKEKKELDEADLEFKKKQAEGLLHYF